MRLTIIFTIVFVMAGIFLALNSRSDFQDTIDASLVEKTNVRLFHKKIAEMIRSSWRHGPTS